MRALGEFSPLLPFSPPPVPPAAVSLHVRGVESAFQTASGFRAPPPSHAEDAAAAPSPLGKLRVIEDAEITEALNFILAERVAVRPPPDAVAPARSRRNKCVSPLAHAHVSVTPLIANQ